MNKSKYRIQELKDRIQNLQKDNNQPKKPGNRINAGFGFKISTEIVAALVVGVSIGFLGIVFLFFDKLVISESNIFYVMVILCGSTFYVVGGILTLKYLKNNGNENVTTSTILWSLIFLAPFCLYQEPWKNLNPSIESTIALVYLGVFATGVAWLLRFHILTKAGMVFQTQVAYLIPIFGIIFGYLIMDEQITWKVLVSLIIIISGIFMVKKSNKGIVNK